MARRPKPINSRCNVPIKLDKYDNESYMKNPLLLFHIADVRERRHFTLLKDVARVVSVEFKEFFFCKYALNIF